MAAAMAATTLFLCNTSSVMTQPQLSKAQAEAVAIARSTAAETLELAPDRFELVSVTPADWRDSSLGCPERGKVYAPALTSGFKVTLRESDREHVVHVAGGRGIVCATQAETRLPVTPRIESSLEAGNAVRAAISKNLGVPLDRVRIRSVKPARSGDACVPHSPSANAFIVDARVGTRVLRYYRDAAGVRACEAAQ